MIHIFDNDTSGLQVECDPVNLEWRCDTDVDSVMSCHSYVFFEWLLSADKKIGLLLPVFLLVDNTEEEKHEKRR